MRMLYSAASVVSLLLVAGPSAAQNSQSVSDWLFGSSTLTGSKDVAQAKPNAPASRTEPALAAPKAATPPATKEETINFDNWILSCREFVDGPKQRNCAATVSVRKSDTNRVVLSWTIRQTDKGQPVAVFETLPGIMIQPGIQVKLEKGTARTVPIAVCEPTWCSGSLLVDKAFAQEISASSKVAIVITSAAGQPLTFEFPIKGFDKAYAKM